jgi:hypothetical protein
MKNPVLIFLLPGILLLGCLRAEKNLEIKGKVQDEFTKAAIPYREIIIQALVINNNKEIPVYTDKFLTDSAGVFTYTLKKDRNIYVYNFSLVGDSNYAYSNIPLGLTELDKYGKYLVFNLKRLTDLTIIIDSESRDPFNNVFYVTWKSDGKEGKTLYPYTIRNHGFTSTDQGLKWSGREIKSEIKTKVFANKETIVRWKIFMYGKLKEVTDTIFCARDVASSIRLKY